MCKIVSSGSQTVALCCWLDFYTPTLLITLLPSPRVKQWNISWHKARTADKVIFFFFFCWKVQELHSDLLIWLQVCVPVGEEWTLGMQGQREQKSMWKSRCLCFGISKQTQPWGQKQSSAKLLLFHISLVSHCGELNVDHFYLTLLT